MSRVSSVAATSSILLLISMPLFADSHNIWMEELHKCREFEQPAARLACYDRIGEVTAPAEAESTTEQAMLPETRAAATVETPSGSMKPQEVQTAPEEADSQLAKDEKQQTELTDDIGRPKSDDAYATIVTKVVGCEEARNRNYYFHFENGQVWRYIGSRKLRYKNCDTPARLIEDKYGFKLQLNGETRQHRIKRIR